MALVAFWKRVQKFFPVEAVPVFEIVVENTVVPVVIEVGEMEPATRSGAAVEHA